jgi:hypothetical protein
MAQFKLGRIKPVYQGAWTNTVGQTYVVDDIVTVGGKTYICVINNTPSSTSFATDLNANPSLWNLVADGSLWRGIWLNSTTYNLGDLALYGGVLYQCTNGHSSAASTATLTATAFTVSAGTATLTYAPQAVQPFLVGATITLAGFSPTQTSGTVNNVNTTFTVVTCTTTQVTFALTGTYTVLTLGTISGTSQLGLESSLYGTISGVTVSTTAGVFTCSATTLNVGMSVVVSGINTTAIPGYASPGPQTYYIIATNGIGTGFTLSSTQGGPAITTVVTSTSGLTFNITNWVPYASNINWIGAWTTNTRYKLNDLVSYGGYTYVCNTAHVSANTITLGLEIDQSKWSTFNAGIYYQNTWSGSNVRYRVNDVVTYGADLWICTVAHTSTSTFSGATNWSLFVAGFEFQNSWINATTYVQGDVVTYGGYTYIALQNNSGQTPSTATAYWQPFTTGLTFAGAWTTTPANLQTNQVGYRIGDVVTVDGYTYLAVADNAVQTVTATATTNATATMASSTISAGGTLTIGGAITGTVAIGMFLSGTGITANTYYIISGSGTTWQTNYTGAGVASTTITGVNNLITVSSTLNLVTGLPITFGTALGGLLTTQQYYILNIPTGGTTFTVSTTVGGAPVTLTTASGSSVGTTSPKPPFATYWAQLNSGIKWNPSYNTYTGLSATNVTGTGSSAVFTVLAKNTTYTVTVTSTGTGYAAGNTLKILGTSLGGLSPANDLTITIGTVTSGAITTITSTGISVTWASAATYVAGDTVLWGVSTYICVLAHVSATGNRPDNDTTGTYWNLMASGTEQAVLTTQGDMFYYGANGPTRLPIGTDGQVLRVNNNAPAWQYYGQINNLVFVSPAGSDVIGNGQGTTIDKPWQSIRYACQQVEDGYLNPNTKMLLTMNKEFMMKEVNNYVQYQYSVNVTSTAATVITVGGSSTTALVTTANLYAGMPIVFTTSSGNIVAGTIYYVATIPSATTFTIATSYALALVPTLFTVGTGTANVGTYSYLGSKAERDSGLVIQGLIYDISHNGTYQTTTNTQSFFTSTGATYAPGVNIYDVTPFNSSLNYLSATLIPNVLTNTAPATNYQLTLNPAINVSAISGSGTLVTVTFTSTTPAPFAANSFITIAGSTSTGSVYNGTWQVTGVVGTTQITFVSTLTATYVSGATIQTEKAKQQINNTYTAETGTQSKAQTLIGYLTTCLTAGTTINVLPAVINPATTISIKTGTYNEILPINVPAYTALLGDELRSTIVQPVSADVTLATVVPKAQVALNRIKALVPNLMSNTAITPTTGNTATQITTLPAASTGSTTAITNLQNSFNILYELVASGVGSTPVIVMPQPTGYNTSALTNTAYATTTGSNPTGASTGYGYALIQIQQNYNFLITDTLQYLINNPGTSGFTGQAGQYGLGVRDITYILDSVLYDLTYGGNTQSLIAGSAYYSLNALQITAAQTPAYVAALTRLKTIIITVAQGTGAATTPTAGNNVTQVTTGTIAPAAAGFFAGDRIQNVINWISNGVADATVAPYIGAQSAQLQTAYNAVTALNSNIASDAQVWVSKYYQAVTFVNPGLINRDAGLVAAYLAYDMVFGSNFNAIQVARAFNRANTSATNLRAASSGELAPTLGAINFTYYKMKQIAASGAVAQIQTTIDDITAYLQGGPAAVPQITWPQLALPTNTVTGTTYTSVSGTNVSGTGTSAVFTIVRAYNGNGYYNYTITPTTPGSGYVVGNTIKILGTSIGGSTPVNDLIIRVTQVSTGGITYATYSDTSAAAGLLEANRAFLLAESVAYFNANYASLLTNPNYSLAKANRDMGYILDAIHYDLVYGGNWASQNAGMAYYSALYGTQISTGFGTAFSATVAYVSTLAQSVVVNTTVASPLQAAVPQALQTTSGLIGASTHATTISGLFTYVTNFVTNGLTAGAPFTTITTITSGTTFTTGSAHGLVAGDIIIPQTTANGLVSTIIGSGTPYYVISTGLTTTQFQLSASYNGTAITTFTSGTGLSLAVQTINMPSLANASVTALAAWSSVSGSVPTYQTSVTNYINTTYTAFTYLPAYAQRDTFNVTLAMFLDTLLGSNFATVQAGRAYNRTQDYKVQGYELTVTVASLNYLETLVAATLSSSIYAAQLTSANTSIYTIISYLTGGSQYVQPQVNGTITYNNTLGIIEGAEILRANIPFLQAEVTAYYAATYTYNVTGTTTGTNVITTGTAHALIINDPVQFTATTASTTATAYSGANITVSSTTGLIPNGTVIFGTSFGNIVAGTTYYLLTASAGVITVSATSIGGATFSVGTTGSMSSTVAYTGFVSGGLTAGTTYYVASVPSTTTFTVTTSEGFTNVNTGATGTPVALTTVAAPAMNVAYYYPVAATQQDIGYYLNAIIYDLQYTGNYRSLRYAQVLLNSINGSAQSNMWLVRNACGVRNMTMNGLTGTLSNVNSFGTKRPTGGAYTSLDPGFGPNDSNAWIYARSCYVQNCTMFGYAVYGAKVDGALHAGGYHSMVSNDYTCIIGDGIGWQTTGAGSLSELVSVFNYYSYAGYLAELGGRIRATNGNSSYGTYGVVAEGVDTTEIPLYGNLNNRYNPAQITAVVTDSTNAVLRFEYQNAGSSYTNAVPSISGSGYNATVASDEFRDAALFETRLIDLNNGNGVGGTSYVTATNTAQGSGTGYAVIAATDNALSNAYNGNRLQITAGTGVGQYANILTYANGTKVATIIKDSFTTLNITAASTTNNLFTVASTANLYTGMPIYVNSAFSALTSGTVYYVNSANFSATQFQVSLTAGGAGTAVTVPSNITTVTITVTATSTVNNLITATNTLVAGQTVTFSSSFNGIDAGTLYYVNATNLTTASFAVSTTPFAGTTITITATGSASSTGTVGTAVFAAGWDHVVQGTAIINGLDLTSAYILEPRISYSAPGYTGIARTMATSATYSGVAYGAGTFVAIGNTGTTTNTSTTGITWAAGGALPSSQTWNNVVYGGGQGAKATAIVGGFGGSGAVLTAVIGTGTSATQIVSVTIVSGGYNYVTPPTIVFVSASGSGATATCTVLNGAITSVTMTINGSGYTSAPTVTAVTSILSSITANSWGKNYYSIPTVTVAQPQGLTPIAYPVSGSVTSGSYYQVAASGRIYICTTTGTTSSTTPTFDYTTASGYTNITNGTAAFTYVATQAQATPTLNNAGVSAIALSIAGYGYTSVPSVTILDTSARFVALSFSASTSTTTAYSTVANLGTTWSSNTTAVLNLYSLAYGNGVYVAVGGASGTATAVSSTDGATWISRTPTALATGYYSAVTYGAGGNTSGTFVAINNGALITSYSNNGAAWSAGGSLPAGYTTTVSVAYGNNKFVTLGSDGKVAYSVNYGVTWTAAPTCAGTTTSVLSSSFTWTKINYAQGVFLAVSQGSVSATSPDGINWTVRVMPSSTNWSAIAFGNPTSATLGAQPLWVAVSSTSGTAAASIRTGAQPSGRMKVASNAITEIRFIEPGSGFAKGNVTTTTVSGNLITVDDTTLVPTSIANNVPIEFTGLDSYGLITNTTYYVIGSTVTTSQFSVTATAGSSTAVILTAGAGLAGIYRVGSIVTQIDPNHVITAPTRVRMGDGALANPSFTNRGLNNATATASVLGDGYADLYQNSAYINVSNVYAIPTAGANVQFAAITGTSQWYKLVQVSNILGIPGNYTATFQINPALSTLLAPANGNLITTRLKYSQVRLTGHDFLYIGSGNQTQTNYPNVTTANAIQANQSASTGGGRVFFTSTDQDGNFNVGNLFGVQQSTGTATLNASAFALSGLQSLTLGTLSVGTGSATITSFSTDPYFTANSDNVVPTQKAIKSYITAQIGGGSSSLNVNTITSGQIYIANNTISNTTGNQILVTSKMTFTGGIDGAPVALAFFSQK